MKFKRLHNENHPRLDLGHVLVLKALYRGGEALLGERNRGLLKSIFPPFMHERPQVYEERCRRAFYEPVFGQTINQISAHLAQDPLTLSPPEDEDEKPSPTDDEEADYPPDDDEDRPEPTPPKLKKFEEPELDEYWKNLQDSTSPPGEKKRPLDELIRDICVEGLVCGWSWIQCDMPPATDKVETTDGATRQPSLLEQEESGALDAYFVSWPTEQVTDWYEKDGQLLWVRTYQCESPADDPETSREIKVHTWTIWTATEATKYEYVEDPKNNKPFPPASAEEDIPIKDAIKHTFGVVPWVRFDTYQKEGKNLHVGDAIASLCVAYFNRSNGETFQWTQFCYQQLYEFLAPEVAGIDTPISEAQQDPHRARRTRAPGQVHVRGEGDRAEYVGPDMTGADVGRSATQDLRDSILRVINMMALSQDTSGAMLRRSGDSKEMDNVAQEVLIGAIGKVLIPFACEVVRLAAIARGDAEYPEVSGYAEFDVSDPDAIINRAALVEAMTIESATYQKERKFMIACADLGDAATPEIRQAIREELESAITQDQIEMAAMPPDPFADEEANPDEAEPDADPDDAPPFPPKKAKGPKKPNPFAK